MQESEVVEKSLSLFNLTIQGFQEVQKAGISLDQLFLLECLSEGTDISKHCHIAKVLAWKQSLERKEFIDSAGYLTESGNRLLHSARNGQSFVREEKERKAVLITDFDRWWKIYPPTDAFEWKNMKFEGSRGIRVKKEECKKKFLQYINEGVTPQDMIKALETEVTMKKDASVKDRLNKLKYMVNSLTYLNNRGWENFLEVSKTYQSVINNTTIDI